MTDGNIPNLLESLGAQPGCLMGLAFDAGVGLGLAIGSRSTAIATTDPLTVIGQIEAELGPRWVWWDRQTSQALASGRIPINRCWDILTVHRLLHGGWRTSSELAWAWLHDLSAESLPQMGQLDLLHGPVDEGDDFENPVRPDGHLRPEWVCGGWKTTPDRLATWAALALKTAALQQRLLDQRPNPDKARSTAHSESAAELMSLELSIEGLPIDEAEAIRIIADAVGPRPASYEEEDNFRHQRDGEVIKHLGPGAQVNLRNPAEVKSMLRRIAIDLPDTRAWRLEQVRDMHPLVEALLTWRKAERISTTYGYRWLDEHVSGGRLRGSWSSSDGAAGRMTASAGLHNLPAEMRPCVIAEAGHVFVRADLGQIEPRVLAAVSGDAALIAATQDDDLYQPIADQLKVEREIAKVAVLGAMYGATTGESAHALPGLQRAYPRAMGVLEDAAASGIRGESVMTIGGRLIRMGVDESAEGGIERARKVAASRGRFARNAIIQGAAAEFFKVWAIIVRSRGRDLGAYIVLCLHDELLIHTPSENAQDVAAMVHSAVDQAAFHWSPSPEVRFLANVSIIDRWSEAKG